MLMAHAIDLVAAETPGKEARAMESFSYALRQIPSIIAENGGYDSAQLVSELRALHTQGKHTMGLGENQEVCRLKAITKTNIDFWLFRHEPGDCRRHGRSWDSRVLLCKAPGPPFGLRGRRNDLESGRYNQGCAKEESLRQRTLLIHCD